MGKRTRHNNKCSFILLRKKRLEFLKVRSVVSKLETTMLLLVNDLTLMIVKVAVMKPLAGWLAGWQICQLAPSLPPGHAAVIITIISRMVSDLAKGGKTVFKGYIYR